MEFDKDAFNILVIRESLRSDTAYLAAALERYPDIREVLYVPDDKLLANARACVYNYRVAYKIVNEFRKWI